MALKLLYIHSQSLVRLALLQRLLIYYSQIILSPFQLYLKIYQYHLFDGPDSLICHQLLELGIPINVENVEWYRRILLKSRGLDTSTWEHYLEVSQAYREREKKYEELYGRTRKA